MSKIRQEKERQIAEIKEKFDNAKAAIITDYRGINVADMTDLRKRLREAGVEYKVLKNTFVKIATEDMEISELDEALQGPTAIAFSYDDAVTAAKILNEFSKDHELKLPKVKAGVLEGKFINVNQVIDLANLPPKEVLLSMVLRTMQAPITGFVRTNSSIITKLLYALNAIKEEKEAI
ncbi:MAG: 50S ribosomal protein L10 [Clostridia bacterium]